MLEFYLDGWIVNQDFLSAPIFRRKVRNVVLVTSTLILEDTEKVEKFDIL